MLKTHNIIPLFLYLFVFSQSLISNPSIAFSDEEKTVLEKEIETAKVWFGFDEKVSIATKSETTIGSAPGIITVITSEQIKQMGFRTLADVLKTVPGFDISMDKSGQKNIAVRGVLDIDSPKVRVMIDGHSINEPGSGGASWNFYDLVVENIRRIEIIRGPGSALYGQNAFLAVINVITKDTDDIDGFQWTASGDNFNMQNYNMLFGKEIGDLKISGFFDYLDTEGPSEKIEQDILFPAAFSNSPGRSQNEKEKTDLNLKLSYKGLELKGKYMKNRREGYIGFADALSDDTEWKDTYIFSELTYPLRLSDKFTIVPRTYYDQYKGDWLVESRPEGFFIEPFPGFQVVYPDGIKISARIKYRTIGFENQVNYNVFEGNDLTFGFQYEWIHQHEINSDANIHPLTFEPLPSFRDFSKDLPLARKATRQIWSLYLQDEWNITNDIDLTVGVRYDHFTRFGGTTNPRVGLAWRFMEDAYMKCLFATAFRAPNFNKLFLVNNPAELGNPSLDPEEVNTFEVGVGYNFTKRISGSVNYFFNRIRDRIVLDKGSPRQWQNSGGARVKGIEAEVKAGFGKDNKDNYAYANYTFQDAEETRDRNRLPDVPIHKANLGINAVVTKYVNANLHTFFSGPRPRESGDIRHDLPSYALVDLTFIGKNFLDNFEIRGSVHNLFDKSYEDPAPLHTVPTDYPQQGTSFFLELRFSH